MDDLFSLPDLSGGSALTGAPALGDATAQLTDNGSGSNATGESWLSSAWNAISSIAPSSNSPSSGGGSGSTASPLSTAVTSIVSAYNSVASLFGARPTNNLANANTTSTTPAAPKKTSPLVLIGLGLTAIALYLLLRKKR